MTVLTLTTKKHKYNNNYVLLSRLYYGIQYNQGFLQRELGVKMKTNRYNLFFIFITYILLTGCTSLSVNNDYNLRTDFSNYRTFDWLPSFDSETVDDLDQARFISFIESQLIEKGFTLDKKNPDFYIAPQFEKQTKQNVTVWDYPYSTFGHYNYASLHGHHGYSPYYSISRRTTVYEYEQGTLILDFIDSKTQSLFWKSVAKEAIRPESTPQEKEKNIEMVVKKILKNFPPENNNQAITIESIKN